MHERQSDKLEDGETRACNVPWIGKISYVRNVICQGRVGLANPQAEIIVPRIHYLRSWGMCMGDAPYDGLHS